MSRDDLINADGIVSEAFAGGKFIVELQNGAKVSATLSGKIRKFHIRVIKGDRVIVGISPYDLTKAIIISRERVQRDT